MAQIRPDEDVRVEPTAVEQLQAAAEIMENLSRDSLLMLRGYAAGLKANTQKGGEKHGSGG